MEEPIQPAKNMVGNDGGAVRFSYFREKINNASVEGGKGADVFFKLSRGGAGHFRHGFPK